MAGRRKIARGDEKRLPCIAKLSRHSAPASRWPKVLVPAHVFDLHGGRF